MPLITRGRVADPAQARLAGWVGVPGSGVRFTVMSSEQAPPCTGSQVTTKVRPLQRTAVEDLGTPDRPAEGGIMDEDIALGSPRPADLRTRRRTIVTT
jgi:hypothetical protein